MKSLVVLMALILNVTSLEQNSDLCLSNMFTNKKLFNDVIITSNSEVLKIHAIRYLLTKRGDKEINRVWYDYTDSIAQQKFNRYYSTEYPRYSLATNQLVALYLISAVYHSNLKFCNEVELLYADAAGNQLSTTNLTGQYKRRSKPRFDKNYMYKTKYHVVDNEIIEQVYEIYESWFIKVQQYGLKNVESPLSNTTFDWK